VAAIDPTAESRAAASAPAAASAITILPPDPTGRIDLCWTATGAGGAGTTRHEFLPDAGAHLVFRLSPSGFRAVLLGPATRRAALERAGGAEYLGVRFRAGQAPRLADVRSSELTDGFADLASLAGEPVDAIGERLLALPDDAARQRALLALVARAEEPLVEDPRCRQATRLLEAARGLVRVDALAAEVGLTVRSLERRFLDAFGVTPKRMARLVRLRYVLGALHARGDRTLAELAAACGYADQAHLVHDFKALTGRVPRAPGAAGGRVVSPGDLPALRPVRR
jgi:AraC-like DNA-binding protein